jgi:putative membrane protein insertion efficiency factor
VIARGAVAAIRWYQRHLSADVGARCRFAPSCSQYAIDAVERFGAAKGLAAAAIRLARCNSRSRGGPDPAADFSWRLLRG